MSRFSFDKWKKNWIVSQATIKYLWKVIVNNTTNENACENQTKISHFEAAEDYFVNLND